MKVDRYPLSQVAEAVEMAAIFCVRLQHCRFMGHVLTQGLGFFYTSGGNKFGKERHMASFDSTKVTAT